MRLVDDLDGVGDLGYLKSLAESEMPEWLEGEADAPAPDVGWGLVGDDGQWEEEREPDAAAAQEAVSRPDFGAPSDRLPEEATAEFYGAAEDLKYADEVILTLGSPVELGTRAILDRAAGSRVPKDHGGYYQVKSEAKGAHIAYADGQLCFYRPERGYWRPVDLEEVAANIQEYDGCEFGAEGKGGKRRVKSFGEGEIQSALKCGLRAVARKGFFEQQNVIPGLCMRDCFWTVRDGDVIAVPHSPWHRVRAGYDFVMPGIEIMRDEGSWERFRNVSPLDPWWQKLCPVWHWLISAALPGRVSDVSFLQELIAASLTGQATQYQRGALLLGRPGAGKSTVIQAIETLFPRGSVASTDPSTWREDYQRAGLVGKLLNTLEEAEKWSALVPLKRCITGDPIEARYLQQNRFEYRPIAGHIYSCNRLPPDVDGATLDRWEVIEFKQRFRGTGLQVAEERILLQIRQELPGFVLWAFHGWLRLARQGRYTVPEDSKRVKSGWAEDTDSVQMFVVRCCDVAEVAFVGRSSLFEAYVAWCEGLRLPERKRVDGLEFKRRINALGYVDCFRGESKARVRAYAGLGLVGVGG